MTLALLGIAGAIIGSAGCARQPAEVQGVGGAAASASESGAQAGAASSSGTATTTDGAGGEGSGAAVNGAEAPTDPAAGSTADENSGGGASTLADDDTTQTAAETMGLDELTSDPKGLSTVAIDRNPAQVISRLTRLQFLRAAAALVGEGALLNVAELVPDPVPNVGFSNSGLAQNQTYDVILGYDTAAQAIVGNVNDWPALFERYGACSDYQCVDDFITAFGSAAFRRPITAAEITEIGSVAEAAEAEALPYEVAVGLLIRAFLQAPEYLYHFEDDELTDHQLAARLSFFLSDAPPDAELLAVAEAGGLDDAEEMRRQVQRLLQEHQGQVGRSFVYDFLGMRRVYQRVFDYDTAMLDALVESIQATFARAVASGADVAELFTTETFVADAAVAQFMGLAPVANGRVEATDGNPFMGLLTHPGVLIAMSNAVEGSTVSRGQFIAHQLLCIPPTPSPNADLVAQGTGVELPEDATQRDEAEARLSAPSCAGCHLQFEPYAFGLSKWGGDGLFKDDPRLDDSGPIVTSLGAFEFSGYREFLPLLGESEQFRRCIADQFVRYALRHTAYPPALLDSVLVAATDSGKRLTFDALIEAIALQGAFGLR